MRIAYLGDIVGNPGRLAVAQQVPVIRERFSPDLIIANAENTADGSGLTPTLYDKLKAAGLDAMTLGDHVFRKRQITATLERSADLIRPLNLSAKAQGRGWMKVVAPPVGGKAPAEVFVTLVLGRLFMSTAADDPFAAVDRLLAELPRRDPVVLVEAHMEATSEKQALAWHLDGRVAAVLGSHTHCPTADARVLPGGTATITDLGMTGPYRSILGRQVEPVVAQMTTQMPHPFDVAGNTDDVRVCGVILDIDDRTRRATAIERLDLPADPARAPFV